MGKPCFLYLFNNINQGSNLFYIAFYNVPCLFKNLGGSNPMPTPAGVPVRIISPALRVSPLEMKIYIPYMYF